MADFTGTAGNDSLTGGPLDDFLDGLAGNDTLVGGDGDDVLRGGAGADSLVGGDGDGEDVVTYSNATAGVRIDLSNVANNSGDAAGDSYDSIEDFVGSDHNDTFIGGAGENFFVGGLGADSFDGSAGGDITVVVYAESAGAVVVNLAAPGSNTGEAAGDTYIAVDAVIGSAFNDTLTGDGGDNILLGNGGADSLNGGGGSDYAAYFNASSAIFASLANPGSNTGDAAGDTYNSIENLAGSDQFSDTLIGNDGNNRFLGSGGADSMVGGLGSDIADYMFADIGVFADLGNPANNNAEAIGDTYLSIEGLRGGDFNDTLVGDAIANSLEGANGNDVVNGLGGADTILGGLGNDTLSGNVGLDSIEGGAGDDSMLGNRGFDTLSGDAGDDFMWSNRGSDWLFGGDGNDTVDGGAGFDTLSGGVGADLVIGNAGNDSIEGNFGADTIVGGVGSDTMFGDTDTDVYRYDALSLNTVDVVANTADSIMGGQGDLISMLGLIDELEIGNVKLNALSSNSAVGGSFVAGQTNVAFSGGDLMFDLNGDGVFSAASDFSIALNQGVTVVTYFASDDMFHIA